MYGAILICIELLGAIGRWMELLGYLCQVAFFFSLLAFMFDIVFCFVSLLSLDLDGAIWRCMELSEYIFHMIDGAKHEIEGINHNIDGAKCQVVKYFVVLSSQI